MTPNQRNSTLSSVDEVILDNDDFPKQLFNGSDASDPYCAVVDTATLPTVVKTEPSSPNTPQCAYRAHNETDPIKSLTYLNIQHPVPIKLEDFPMSPASETVPTDEHCYSTSNNAPVNFDLADDPETLPGPEIDPEPMVIELLEEELPAIVEANQTFEAPKELPMANIQQPYRHCFLTHHCGIPIPSMKSTSIPFECFRIHFITRCHISNSLRAHLETLQTAPSTCATYTSAFHHHSFLPHVSH
jgi:hypothetical protein